MQFIVEKTCELLHCNLYSLRANECNFIALSSLSQLYPVLLKFVHIVILASSNTDSNSGQYRHCSRGKRNPIEPSLCSQMYPVLLHFVQSFSTSSCPLQAQSTDSNQGQYRDCIWSKGDLLGSLLCSPVRPVLFYFVQSFSSSSSPSPSPCTECRF